MQPVSARPSQGKNSRVVAVCRSVHDYARCLLESIDAEERSGDSITPILSDDDGRSPVRLWGDAPAIEHRPYVPTGVSGLDAMDSGRLLRACAERNEARSGGLGSCCVVAENDPAAIVGAGHAILARKHLVIQEARGELGALHAGIAPDASLTVVMSSDRMAAIGTDRMSEELDRCAKRSGSQADSRSWGLLTGSGIAELSNLVARIHLRRFPTARRGLSCGLESLPALPPHRDGLDVVQLPNHPVSEVARLVHQPVPFLSFVGHGRSYCAAGGNLCSRLETAVAGDRDCVGGLECVFSEWPRVPARNLRAEVVLLDSCSTSSFRLLGPEMEHGLNLAVHLLDGFAAAVISPHRTNVPLPMTPYLAWALLAQGLPLGAVCRELNAVAERLRARRPFLLLGDPDMRAFTPPSGTIPAEVEETTPGCWSLHLPPSSGVVTYHELVHPGLSDQARKHDVHCLNGDGAGDLLSVRVLPPPVGEGTTRMVTLWATDERASGADVYLFTRPPFRTEVVESVTTLLENLRINEEWLSDEPCVPQVSSESGASALSLQRELETLLKTIERPLLSQLGSSTTDPAGYLALYASEQRVLALSAQIEDQMMARLSRRARDQELWIRGQYTRRPGTRRLRETLSSTPCPRCGGSVCARRYQVGLWPKRIRMNLECDRCMSLYDVDEGALELTIVGPEHACRGRPFELRIAGTNRGRHSASIRASLVLDRMGHPASLISVTPEVQTTVVEAGHAFDFAFDVVMSPTLPTHLFHIKGLVLKNGSIGWALKKLFASPPCAQSC